MRKFNLTRSKYNIKNVAAWFQQAGNFLFVAVMATTILLAGCESSVIESSDAGGAALESTDSKRPSPFNGSNSSYEFNGPVYDISATPDGSILVAETIFTSAEIPEEGETSETVIKRIDRRKGVSTFGKVETVQGAAINGLAAQGAKNFFAASGGPDQAVGAKVYRINPGGQWMVGDIEEYEQRVDVDANKGVQWKNTLCEAADPFTAGPQSNPYHLAIDKSDVIVADAAGNSLLTVNKDGSIDWVAVFTPPTNNGGSSNSPDDWMQLFAAPGLTCYVQPVPTAVAVAPNGDYYVGELTGVTPTDIGLEEGGKTTGLSRVWRINAGARNVNCPSDECEVVVDGLTSVIDIEMGPDGWIYLIEYDKNGWFTATTGASPAGGTLKRCNPDNGTCETVERDSSFLLYPGAITFDKWDNLWLLESNIANPAIVRQVALD